MKKIITDISVMVQILGRLQWEKVMSLFMIVKNLNKCFKNGCQKMTAN